MMNNIPHKCLLYNNIAIPVEDLPDHAIPKVGDKCLFIRDKNYCILVYNRTISQYPEDGLVFYAPFIDKASTAETGQALTYSSGVVQTTIGNISCLNFPGMGDYVTAHEESFMGNVLNTSVSMWLYIPSEITTRYDYPHFFMLGIATTQYGFLFGTFNKPDNTVNFQTLAKSNTWPSSNAPIQREKWTHVCGVVENGIRIQTYVDGVPSDEVVTLDSPIVVDDRGSSDCIKINRQATDGEGVGKSYICGVRIYNRVLNDNEIMSLSKEFVQI